MSEQEERLISKKAHECVEYILLCTLAERKAIVRRTDINKHVCKEHTRLFREIIKQAKKYLNNLFGLVLIDLDNEKGEKFGVRSKFEYDSELTKPDYNDGDSGHFISQFADSDTNVMDADRAFEDQFKYGTLIIALSLIFMNDNEIDSNLFWDSLKRLDIHKDEKKHKYFGDVTKYFTKDLVNDGY